MKILYFDAMRKFRNFFTTNPRNQSYKCQLIYYSKSKFYFCLEDMYSDEIKSVDTGRRKGKKRVKSDSDKILYKLAKSLL